MAIRGFRRSVLSTRSYFVRERSTVISCTTATYTDVASELDTSKGSDFTATSTTVLTVNTDGVYRLSAHGGFEGHANGGRVVRVLVNGTDPVCEQTVPSIGASQGTHLSGSEVLTLSADDTLKFQIYQNSNSTLDTEGSMSFAIERIS